MSEDWICQGCGKKGDWAASDCPDCERKKDRNDMIAMFLFFTGVPIMIAFGLMIFSIIIFGR